MAAAEFWIEAERPHKPSWRLLALGLCIGLLLGVGLAALAGPRLAPVRPEARAQVSFEHPALDREWRGFRTPVDVDRMFPRRGR